VVCDHKSTNGTRVVRDGARIDLATLSTRELLLADGDELELGERAAIRCASASRSRRRGLVPHRRDPNLRRRRERRSADPRGPRVLQKLYEATKAIGAPTSSMQSSTSSRLKSSTSCRARLM